MPGQPGRKAFPEPGTRPARPACSVQGWGPGRAHLLPTPTRTAPNTASQDPSSFYLQSPQQAHPKVHPGLPPPTASPGRKSHRTHIHPPTRHCQAGSHWPACVHTQLQLAGVQQAGHPPLPHTHTRTSSQPCSYTQADSVIKSVTHAVPAQKHTREMPKKESRVSCTIKYSGYTQHANTCTQTWTHRHPELQEAEESIGRT